MTETAEIENDPTAGKYLTFAISKERYGVAILTVQEIIKVIHITAVPSSPPFIKGVINLRGKIIPVMDLRLKFGIEPLAYNERTCIIILNIVRGEQRFTLGIIVDTVLDVIDFLPGEIEPPPDYGTHLDSSFIIGMGKKDDELNILIDIEKAITEQGITRIAEMHS